MTRALAFALCLLLLPAAVEPQDIVRGNQMLALCQSFQGFDARMSTLEDTGWDRLDPAKAPPAAVIDAFAFLGATDHMSPRAAIAARWQSVMELGRRSTRARLLKKDTYFFRSALYHAPEAAGVYLHMTETRLSADERRLSCAGIGLTGETLTTVSRFRKTNILGAFAEMELRHTTGQDARSTGTLILFDQAELARMLPDIAAPAYGIAVSTTLPSKR